MNHSASQSQRRRKGVFRKKARSRGILRDLPLMSKVKTSPTAALPPLRRIFEECGNLWRLHRRIPIMPKRCLPRDHQKSTPPPPLLCIRDPPSPLCQVRTYPARRVLLTLIGLLACFVSERQSESEVQLMRSQKRNAFTRALSTGSKIMNAAARW